MKRKRTNKPNNQILKELLSARKQNKQLLKQINMKPVISGLDTEMDNYNPEDSEIEMTEELLSKNRFSALKNIDNDKNMTNDNTKVKKIKHMVTPIVAQGCTPEQIIKEMNGLKITEFNVKIISIGIKVILFNNDDKQKLQAKLAADNIEHFSFGSSSDAPLKIIFSGLPKSFSDEYLKEGLKAKGINENDVIRIIRISDKSTNDFLFHLIHFNRINVTFNQVKLIKDINHVIVTVSPYKNTSWHPTQCRKCQMYGHGTAHCSRKVRCLKCGEDHLSTDCQKTENQYKCSNCKGTHQANDKSCPKLKEYVLLKDRSNLNRQIRNFTPVSTQSNLRTNSNSKPQYGNIHSSRNAHNTKQYPNETSGPNYSTSFPDLEKPKQTAQREQWHAKFKSPDNDLFTLHEITSLVNEIVQRLSQCKTKADQFLVISELSIKYIYGSA